MSDAQTVPETETTAKPSPPELLPEEPAATAPAQTPAAAPPAAESSEPSVGIRMLVYMVFSLALSLIAAL